MYAFTRRPAWIAAHLLLIVVVCLFALAGVWQLHRLHDRRAYNAAFRSRSSAVPIALRSALEAHADPRYRRVTAVGRYDRRREVVLIGRADQGRQGNHVLTPLVTSYGHAIVVDRGWVPTAMDRPPVAAAPPDREVKVEGILFASEGHPFGSSRRGRVNVLTRVDVERIAAQLPYPTYSFYLALRSQQPAQPADLPVRPQMPELTEGPHLSYAVQWFSFMPIAVIGYGALIRQRARRARATARLVASPS